MSLPRKLAAVLSADVQGYSRLMGEDEVATVQTLTAYREVMTSLIGKHRGRLVDATGDNLLAEFASVVDALESAVAIQRALKARNAELPESRRMEFRIGLNLGDVIVDGPRIYGDGVNIAARVEGLAEGGGIALSGTAYDQVKGKLALGYESLGEHAVKNIAEPVRVYRVQVEPSAPAGPVSRAGWARIGRRGKAVGVVIVLVVAMLAFWWVHGPLRPPPPPAGSDRSAALDLPDKPSLAVLPFVNMSEDQQQDYFSDGMTEDLITALSKLSGLFVIARNSVFTYKDKPVRVQEVGRELGVRYVLEGSVRKAGDRVRITAQLVDARTEHHLWAERYDRDLKDVFALQDEITQKIVAALAVTLSEGEQDRLARTPTENLEAYDSLLRGSEDLRRSTREGTARAREMFERAIDLDSQYAAAYALLGMTYWLEWAFQWSQDPSTLERAFRLAQKAIALDDSLPLAHRVLGHVYLWKKQHERAVAAAERALALDPNGADGYATLGELLTWAGRPEEAVALLEKAMRLNPEHPIWYLFDLGHAYYVAERYEDALSTFKRARTRNPDWFPSYPYLAATYVAIGRTEGARAAVAECRRINPQATLESVARSLPYKDQAQLERFLERLRAAGLPERVS